MKTLLAVLMSTALIACADTEAEISGAFGVQLGMPLKGVQIVGTNDLGGNIAYEFAPTNGLAPFNYYLALVTAKSRVVFMVAAKATQVPKNEMQAEVDKLRLMLTRKYGAPQADTAMRRLKGVTEWQSGKRVISLDFPSAGKFEERITLTYGDEDLAEQAKREAAELKATGADASGL